MTGKTFGQLKVLKFVRRTAKDAFWKCICDCGKKSVVSGSALRTGRTKSCGCLRDKAVKLSNTTHGHVAGGLATKTYRAWHGMKARCYCRSMPSFHAYGGRGITVCDRWRNSFENFLADMGECPEGLSLERKNTNGNYEPSNCKWADQFEQQNNRRNNHPVTFNGETLNVIQWARKVGLPPKRVAFRLAAGWSVKRAITEPLHA